jgi:hypothetical protein
VQVAVGVRNVVPLRAPLPRANPLRLQRSDVSQVMSMKSFKVMLTLLVVFMGIVALELGTSRRIIPATRATPFAEGKLDERIDAFRVRRRRLIFCSANAGCQLW